MTNDTSRISKRSGQALGDRNLKASTFMVGWSRRAAVPGSRRRPDTRSPCTGERYDQPTMNVDAFKFLSGRAWPDLFEILLVSFVIYRFLLFLVGTRALQIVIGLVILSLTYFVALFAK